LCDLVSLTKTKAKDRTSKTKYIETIRRALDEYAFVYLFSYDNMRSTLFKDIRMDWRESRIVLGKNSVTQIALGRTAEDEYKDNLRYISQRIDGNVGLLFTNRSREETER
jgi:mRNA turnover protein 4